MEMLELARSEFIELENNEVLNRLNTVQTERQSNKSDVAFIADYDDGLLKVAGPAMIGCYLFSLAVMAITLASDGVALFMLAISTFYLAIYFVLPKMFLNMRKGMDPRYQQNLEREQSDVVEIHTGTIHRGEALLQMLLIPIAVVVTLTSFCIITFIQGV
jgi:ABC-type transport system involved in cytochrome bd biosynthesis fused ATPase/permease subunit